MNMIITDECEKCTYGSTFIDEKGRLRVMCAYREKIYWYGQCIPCEDKVKRSIEDNEESCQI